MNEEMVIPLEELGKVETVKVYNQAYVDKQRRIAELESQIEKLKLHLHNKQVKEYIRFGEIPKDGKSKIGNGCIGDGYKCIGYENGVSVWDCIYNFDTGLYQLVIPHPTKFTSGDFSQASDPDNCCGCDPDEKIYVVTGKEIGYGSDNEPLLKDVKIVKELPFDYFKQIKLENNFNFDDSE